MTALIAGPAPINVSGIYYNKVSVNEKGLSS
jgi:hypothetical protein